MEVAVNMVRPYPFVPVVFSVAVAVEMGAVGVA